MKRRLFLFSVITIMLFLCSCFDNGCKHEYGDWLVTSYPTHSSLGKYYRECNICKYKDEYTMADLNSETSYNIDIITEPTCSKEGKGRYTFIGGMTQITFEADVKKSSHTFNLFQKEEKNDSYHKATCKDCGEIISVAHDYIPIDEVKSTCQEKGHSKGYICKTCDYLNSDVKEYDVVDHNYLNGKCEWCNNEKMVTITYVYSDGTEEVIEALYNSNFNNIELESDVANIFLGWYKDNKKLDNTYVLTDNIKVYAKWQKLTPIKTANEFLNMDMAGSYYLANNIDLDGITLKPFESFTGYLDGKGHNISNFILLTNSVNTNYAMFKVNKGNLCNFNLKDFVVNYDISFTASASLAVLCADNKGIIDGVNILDSSISMSFYSKIYSPEYNFGGLVAVNNNKILNSSISGTMIIETKGDWDYEKRMPFTQNVGGLTGVNKGEIKSSNSSLQIDMNVYYTNKSTQSKSGAQSYNYVGGLVGVNDKGSIADSFSTTKLKFTSKRSVNFEYQIITIALGNLVGINKNSSKINRCYSTGSVSGGAENSALIGGLVGHNTGESEIIDCYSLAEVKGNESNMPANANVGGLVGENAAKLSNSYAKANVITSTYTTTGGLVGLNASSGIIFKSFALGNLTVNSGLSGKLVGKSEGIITKGYSFKSQIISKGDSKNCVLNATSIIEDKLYNELVDKDFLTNNLSWDTEKWFISGNDDPMLNWEVLVEGVHKFVKYTKAATCTTEGVIYYHCAHCNKTLLVEVIDPLGHANGVEYEVETWRKATHTKDGWERYKCEKGCIYVVSLPKIELDFELKCSDMKYDESNDSYYYECSCGKCDNEIITNNSDEIIHSYNEAVIIIESTCIKGGKNSYECKDCGYIHEVETKPLGHNYIDNICDNCNEEKVLFDVTASEFIGIESASDFTRIINANLNGKYYLVNDIDFNYDYFTTIGSAGNPFKGILYGNGKKILNLAFENKSDEYTGIFAYNNGIIAGLTIENSSLKVNNVSNARASLIAAVNNGEIYDCIIKGTTYIELISNLYSENNTNITRTYNYVFGCITAENNNYVDNCKITGEYTENIWVESYLNTSVSIVSLNKEITLTNKTAIKCGALVGINNANISNCINEAKSAYPLSHVQKSQGFNTKLKAEVILDLYTGALVGYNFGTVSDCKSIVNTNEYHTKEAKYLELIDGTIYKTYYKLTYYTVFEEYKGIVGYNEGIFDADVIE